VVDTEGGGRGTVTDLDGGLPMEGRATLHQGGDQGNEHEKLLKWARCLSVQRNMTLI
jgi:hypothetical protein